MSRSVRSKTRMPARTSSWGEGRSVREPRVATSAVTTSRIRSCARLRSPAPARGSPRASSAAEASARWSSTVRRRASVGWAVRTGMTSIRSRSACTSSGPAPAAASSATAAAREPSAGGAPARSRARSERTRWTSSAVLMRWKNPVNASASIARSRSGRPAMDAENAARPPGSRPCRSATADRRDSSTRPSASAPCSSATVSPRIRPRSRISSRSPGVVAGAGRAGLSRRVVRQSSPTRGNRRLSTGPVTDGSGEGAGRGAPSGPLAEATPLEVR